MSFPVYPEHRDSGIAWLGSIPEHWLLYRSKNVFSERNIKALESDEQLTASQKYGVIPQKLFSELEGQKVMQVILGRDILKKAEVNDFVISMRSFQGGLEFCSYSGAVSSAYVPIYASRAIDNRFFKHLFKSRPFISALQNTSNLIRDGQALRYNNLVLLSLPFPSAKEQKTIGAFLDHETARIDALIEEQQRLIELLKEKRQAVISHAVTKGLDPTVPMKDSGVEWLGEVPAHWTLTKLKFVTDQVVDCPHETPIYDPDGDYLVIRTADIDQGVLKPERMYRLDYEQYMHRTRRMSLEKNDVVYSREGERWGHAALVPQADLYALGQRMMQLRVCDSVCPEFFMYQLNSVATYRQGEVDTVGATSPHVNISTVINYCLMQPAMAEQREISQYLSKTLDTLDCLIGESLEMNGLLQERRSALISAAVTGKIDVRGWQPPANAKIPELEQEAV
jgi:type I restriction enzyme S subunit